MSADTSVETYLAESASWDRDRWLTAQASARRAWIVAAGSAVMAVLSIAALAALVPLKSVAPFVIRVDSSTGIVDVVPELGRAAGTVPETVTRYLLTHYVLVHERFNFATAEADYAEVGAFQSPRLNQTWYARWNPGNPDSPLNRFKDGAELEVAVQAVSFLPRANGVNDLAQVRYAVTRREGGDSVSSVAHFIATIQFAYMTPSSHPTVRQWNPLGFRIVAFHPELEVLTPAGPAGPAGPADGTLKKSFVSSADPARVAP